MKKGQANLREMGASVRERLLSRLPSPFSSPLGSEPFVPSPCKDRFCLVFPRVPWVPGGEVVPSPDAVPREELADPSCAWRAKAGLFSSQSSSRAINLSITIRCLRARYTLIEPRSASWLSLWRDRRISRVSRDFISRELFRCESSFAVEFASEFTSMPESLVKVSFLELMVDTGRISLVTPSTGWPSDWSKCQSLWARNGRGSSQLFL